MNETDPGPEPRPERTVYMYERSASVKLTIQNDGWVRLSNLFSHDRKRGHAKALMEKVIQWADFYRCPMILEVGRYGHPIGPDNSVLEDFYLKFGFTNIDGQRTPVKMERLPRG